MTAYSATDDLIDKTMEKWGILDGYLGWKLSDFGIDGHVDWSGGGFYLQGVTGAGKSCMASALIRDRADDKHPQTGCKPVKKRVPTDEGSEDVVIWELPEKAVSWHYALEIPRLITDTWKSKKTEDKTMKTLLKHDIVVIDDFGSEKMTEQNISIMREVIERCVNGKVNLIITSNQTIKEIYERDSRTSSRLATLHQIKFPEVDLRIKAAIDRKGR